MTNYIKASLASAALIGSFAGLTLPVATQAATPSATNTCGLTTAITGATMSVSGQTATASFTVPATCASSEFSIVSYRAPNSKGIPITQQTIFQSLSETFGPGAQTMSIQLPNCFYQADLYTGPPVDAQSTKSVDTAFFALALQSSANGGTTSCTAATPVTPAATPTPVPTPAPATTAAATVTPAPALPDTGPEDALAGLIGSGTLGYAAMAYRRSRQTLADKLRRK
jgi:hypothetical protein